MLKVLKSFRFIESYFSIFMHYWKKRKQNEVPNLKSFETEFLPHDLSLMHTGLSPLPYITANTIIAVLVVLIIWSYFGKIDVVVSATGKIIPNNKTKIIQSITTANINKIYVQEGQNVKAGDMLVELDATQIKANIDNVNNEFKKYTLQKLRAQSMLDAINKNISPTLANTENIDNMAYQEALLLMNSMYQEYTNKINNNKSQILQKQAEINAILMQINKINSLLPNLKTDLDVHRKLSEENYVAKNDILAKENIVSEQQGNLSIYQQNLNQAQAAYKQALNMQADLKSQTSTYNLNLINDASQKLQSINQELIKLNNQYQSYYITAPINGNIHQLSINTIGGVVTSAQQLMAIVPQNEALEIEAQVENKDVGFINVGQEAEIKVDAFPYTKYGVATAKITNISHDAINNEKLGLIYSIRLKIDKPYLQAENNKKLYLNAGMQAIAEIKTDKRRIIDYFIGSFKENTSNAFKEQ